MNSSMPSVIRRSVLHRISHTLFDALIRHVFADVTAPTTWPERVDWCYAAVTRAFPPVPPSVREVFDGIQVLATEAGSKLLLEAAAAQGIDFVAEFGYLSKEDRAVVAYLELPSIFAAARVRARNVPLLDEPYFLFAGPAQSRIAMEDLKRRKADAASVLSSWLHRSGRPGRPVLELKDCSAYLCLDALTCGLPSTGLGLEGELVPSASLQDVTILLDPKMRFVAVRSDDSADTDFYRRLAGIIAADCPDTFYTTPLVTVPQIIKRDRLIEFQDSVPGLASVRLVEAQLGFRPRGSIGFRPEELQSICWTPDFMSRLSGDAKLTFELRVVDGGPPYIMQVAPPNRVWFDHRAIGLQVLQFLQAQSLLRI